MHCNILTLNTALATHVDDTQIFNVIQLRKKGLAIGNINTTLRFDRRIIYKAKMTARPMQFNIG